MRINTLSLRNFKQYRDETIQFTNGITGIVGKNGAGKSTIVNAILFALYGIQGSGLNSNHIVTALDDTSEETEVSLVFTIENDEYSITRRFNKTETTTKHDAILYMNGLVMTKGVSDVAGSIQSIVGLTAQDFRNTIYAGQNDLLTLIDSNPTARKEWFARMLGIDYIKTRALTILKDEIDTIKEEYQRVTGRLDDIDIDHCRLQISIKTDMLAELEEIQNNLTKNLTRIEREIQDLTREATNLHQIEKVHTSATTMLDSVTNRMVQIQTDLTDLKEKHITTFRLIPQDRPINFENYPNNDRIEKLTKEIREETALRDKFTNLQSKIDSKETFIKYLESVIAQAQTKIEMNDIEGLNKKIATLKEEIDKSPTIETEVTLIDDRLSLLDHDIGILKTQLDTVKEDRDNLITRGESGTCPMCGQTLKENLDTILARFDTEIDDINARIEELTDEKQTVIDKYTIKSKQLKEYQKKSDEYLALVSNRDAMEQFVNRYRDDIDDNKSSIHAATKEISHLVEEQQSLTYNPKTLNRLMEEKDYHIKINQIVTDFNNLTRAIAEKEYEFTTIGQEKIKLQNRIAEIQFDPAALQRVRASLTALNLDRDATIHSINETKIQITTAHQHRDMAKEKHATALRLQKEQAALSDQIEILTATRKLIGEFVVHLLVVVKDQIEGIISTIIGEITAGKYEDAILDEDFNILVRSADGKFYPAERYSGGEKDIMAIALRIALGRYIASINNVRDATFMIFDEIFGSQDEERQQALIRMLRSQKSHFPQIFIISHIGDVQGEFEQTLLVEQDTDLSSHVREITV